MTANESVLGPSASRRRNPIDGPEVESEQPRCLAVEQAVAADEGLSTLGRGSTSRGRAALSYIVGRRAAPAVLLSTIT